MKEETNSEEDQQLVERKNEATFELLLKINAISWSEMEQIMRMYPQLRTTQLLLDWCSF